MLSTPVPAEVAFTSVFQGCCLPGSTLHSVITKAKVQGWVNNVAYAWIGPDGVVEGRFQQSRVCYL